jgi:predicted hotdog family 3-hydroxylacyl-ACP dehydratase
MGAPTAFPLPAEAVLPQRPPMMLLHQLLSCTESAGSADAVIAADNPFLSPDGTLHPAALFELMAQAYAAVHGCQNRQAGEPVGVGFLGGIRHAVVHEAARAGDRLLVDVRRTAVVPPFVLAHAQVARDGRVLAEGELTLFIPPPAPAAP